MVSFKIRCWYRIKKVLPKKILNHVILTYYNIRAIKYYGNKYSCPVCNAKLKTFIGTDKICPRCGAGGRHKILWVFLKKKTDFFENQLRVLHFSPEYCFFNIIKKMKNLDYLSADIDSPWAMESIDISDIKYPDETFDVSISSHVLPNVNDDIKAMKELYRVQKKKSWGIHLVPVDDSLEKTIENPPSKIPESDKKFSHCYPIRIYGKDYVERLESAGFKVELFITEDFCNEEEINKWDLMNGCKIYYCIKG